MRVPVFGMTVKSGGADLPVDGLYVDLPDPPPTGLQVERGVWAPVIGGSVSETGQAYSSQTGHYVKIGPLVTAWSYTQFSAKGQIVGDLLLKGLPFRTLNAPGFFADWKPCDVTRCRKCNGLRVQYRVWESSGGAYEDYNYRCEDCGTSWWVDGIDS